MKKKTIKEPKEIEERLKPDRFLAREALLLERQESKGDNKLENMMNSKRYLKVREKHLKRLEK